MKKKYSNCVECSRPVTRGCERCWRCAPKARPAPVASSKRTVRQAYLFRRNVTLRGKYGIDNDGFERLFLSSGRSCQICHSKIKRPKAGNVGAQAGIAVIDHDHKTGKIRGILCGKCNSGIGFLKDDGLILRSALLYLDKHNLTDGAYDQHKFDIEVMYMLESNRIKKLIKQK